MQKIALEEHFITSDFLQDTRKVDFAGMNQENAADFQTRLLDFDDLRIKAMDEAGIEISVLSLTDPGIQGIADTNIAIELAHKTNDFLAEKISKNPKRFRGFACIPLQDPVNAAKELERCVRQHGFVGGLINGQTQGSYLDEEKFHLFWKKVEELNVPIYLHPGNPQHMPSNYKDQHELAGPLWGWTVETGTHALRMVFSGLFDRFPGIRIILGHMGEAIPYLLWRLDSRSKIIKHPKKLQKSPSQCKIRFKYRSSCKETSFVEWRNIRGRSQLSFYPEQTILICFTKHCNFQVIKEIRWLIIMENEFLQQRLMQD